VGIVGRSGVGKTTLLRAVLGDSVGVSGSVEISPILRQSARIGYVPQKDASLPWKTVRENIRWALNFSRAEDRSGTRIDMCLQMVDLTAHAEKYPDQLSGGMSRRLMVAKALVIDPSVLILDEAFGGLDEETKQGLINLLRKYLISNKVALLSVSHDYQEVVALCNRAVQIRPDLTAITVPYSWDHRNLSYGTKEVAVAAIELYNAVQTGG